MIDSNRARTFLKLPLVIAMATVGLAAQQASAHGYIESPKSRSYLCQIGEQNFGETNCGDAVKEPQSVEYNTNTDRTHYNGRACHGSFTSCGPADGDIAGGGLRRFNALDQQTSSIWKKIDIKPGLNTFDWRYTARHRTANWEFFITKKDWNPNLALTRDSFESTPLLTQPHNNQMPTPQENGKSSHQINIPADRSGYHIVLATWKVGDNNNTFYQVVDLNIDNADAPQSAWNSIGTVPTNDLSIGDKVKTRPMSNGTELTGKQVELVINSLALTKASAWNKALAEKVNKLNYGYLIGELDDKDNVIASHNQNSIYVKKGSDITTVMVETDLASKPIELSLSGVKSEYTIKDGKVDLQFDAIAKNGEFTFKAEVKDANSKSVGLKETAASHIFMTLNNVTAGEHTLIVTATDKNGVPKQASAVFNLKAEANTGDGGNEGGNGGESGAKYDYVFPNGLKDYKPGTVVLHPKTGKTYECKPFPYSGWCTQWTSGATGYEPGVGSAWQSAWIAK